jgi:uncharacterized iron-regulated membrane protein
LQLGGQKNFFTVMRQLHRWLLGDFKRDGSFSLGKTVVGVSTLLFVFILISGIIIWIPKTKKALTLRLKIKVSSGWRRFWYDLHVAGGVYAVLLLLAMALTGLTWSFGWYRTGFYRVFGVEATQMAHGAAPQPANKPGHSGNEPKNENNTAPLIRDSLPGQIPARGKHAGNNPDVQQGRNEHQKMGNGVNYRQWQTVVDQLKAQYSGYKSLTVQDGKASVSLSGLGNSRASDSYVFDAATGEITNVAYYKDSEKSAKLRGWIFAVHVGAWGGTLTRILTFLAALLGATLPLTGYYIWIRKKWCKG